jgi:putative oxidoreductase
LLVGSSLTFGSSTIGDADMDSLSAWQPRLLSLLRIIAGLLFLQHGLVKMFSFPGPFMRAVATGELIWFAALLEIAGGILLVLGLFTRPTAFICSGLMAFAYFLGHAFGPTSKSALFPILNGGNLAILYCFVFLYIASAGPGPWSLDAKQGRA